MFTYYRAASRLCGMGGIRQLSERDNALLDKDPAKSLLASLQSRLNPAAQGVCNPVVGHVPGYCETQSWILPTASPSPLPAPLPPSALTQRPPKIIKIRSRLGDFYRVHLLSYSKLDKSVNNDCAPGM